LLSGNSASWTKVSAGDVSSYGIKTNGTLYSWGTNITGQLGQGDTSYRSSPTQIGTRSWTNVFAHGSSFVHAIRSDNKLYAWGLGTSGQLGNSVVISRSSPVQVDNGNYSYVASYPTTPNVLAVRTDGGLYAWGNKTNILLSEFSNASYTYSWTQVSVGASHGIALRNDGRIFTWGLNSNGQLGLIDNISRSSPVQVGSGTDNELWNSVAATGTRTYAVRNDGKLFTWGRDPILNATSVSIYTNNTSSPVQIGNDTSYVSVSAGVSHAVAIDITGSIYGWGDNTYTQVAPPTTNWSIAKDGMFIRDGYLYGIVQPYNNYGQGDGSTIIRSNPVQIGPYQWSTMSNSIGNHTIAIRNDGSLWSWGSNLAGELGDYNSGSFYRSSMVQIGSSSWSSVAVRRDGAATGAGSAAIRIDGTLWGWGNNAQGQIGDGTTTNKSSPVTVAGGGSWSMVAKGPSHTVALSATKLLYGWGLNTVGQLGDLSIISRSSPVQIGTSSWLMVTTGDNYSLGIDINYKLYAWGTNNNNILGVDTLSWITISSGQAQSLFIRSDNSLWGTGYNGEGMVGDGTTVNRSSPVQIGTDYNWQYASSNYIDSITTGAGFGIKTNGTLWGWGRGGSGEIGDGFTIARSSPVQVAGGGSWVFAMSTYTSAFGIKTNGLLYGWGDNSSRAFGNNSTTSTSSPVQIGNVGTSSWTMLAAGGYSSYNSFAGIQNNGTLWGWGYNGFSTSLFQTGDTIFRSNPVQIGSDTDWKYINIKSYGSAGNNWIIGVKTNGSMWAWGENNQGQLGQGDTIDRSSPVQIGIGSSWNIVYTEYHNTAQAALAQRSDGTLWQWGYLVYSGLDISVYRSSPVQVGATYNFVNINSMTNYYSNRLQGNWPQINKTRIAFGWNSYGALGDGTGGSHTSPIVVSAATPNPVLTPSLIGTSSWSVITSGFSNVTGITTDGKLFTWGANDYGQLGLGDTIRRSSPTQVGSSSWTMTSGNYRSTYAFALDGTLYAWGDYALGDGITGSIYRSSPVQIGTRYDVVYYPRQISTSTSFSQISAGGYHNLAISTTNKLYGWGRNDFGQIGTTYDNPKYAIGLASNAFVLSQNGSLYAWGRNVEGQLGQNDTVSRSSPVQISINSWSQVSVNANGTLLGIKTDGSLWAWGYNIQGQLGIGDYVNRSSPVQVGTSSWNMIATGDNHTLGIDKNYRLYGWGSNSAGQLANTTGNFVQAYLAQGTYGAAFFLRNDGVLYGSGYLYINGTLSSTQSPVVITSGSVTKWRQAVVANPPYGPFAAISYDYNLYTWGFSHTYGEQGNNTNNTANPSPTLVTGGGSWNFIAAGQTIMLGVKTDGTLYAWGRNSEGGIGDGTTISRSVPAQIGTDTDWESVYSSLYNSYYTSFAIKNDGRLYAWGKNSYGELGQGNTIATSSPVQIGGSWSMVHSHARTNNTTVVFGIKTNGTLWRWGYSIFSSGINSGNVSSPVQIGTDTDWNYITGIMPYASSGYDSVIYAYKTNGALYYWGSTVNGGNTPRLQYLFSGADGPTSPILLVSSTSYNTMSSSILKRSTGPLAFSTDTKTLYGWGDNNQGDLGLNDTIGRSSPTQLSVTISYATQLSPTLIDSNSSWSQVAASLSLSSAITTDNRLFMWGQNSYGELGQNDSSVAGAVTRSSPTQVGGSWSSVSTGAAFTIAIKTDGSLWSWGLNSYGQLGLSTAPDSTGVRSSPVQVGTNSWKLIATGATRVLAIRNDNTLWAWGQNDNGQLGLGDTLQRSSPVQVGNGTWSYITLISTVTTSVTYALDLNNILFVWGGRGAYDNFGDGNTGDRSSPVQLGTVPTGTFKISSPVQIGTNSWTSIGAGLYHSVAARSDYQLYAWGDNRYYQNGNITPTTILSTANNQNNNAGSYIRSTGKILFAWGPNDVGQLGTNDVAPRSNPVQIFASPYFTFNKVVKAKVATNGYTLAIDTTGQLFAWGSGAAGALGTTSTINRSSPTQVGALTNWSDIAAGPSHALAIKSDGSLWGWGLNTSGQAGTLSWGKVSSGSSHTLAIRSDGQLFGWGKNDVGQVGDNSVVTRSSPVQLGTGSFSQVSAGIDVSAAIRGDGLLYTWGLNTNGALGLSDGNNRSAPVQLGSSSWTQVSAKDYMLALRSDGTAWAWGNNSAGQIGDGSTTNRNSPTQPRIITDGLYSYSFFQPSATYLTIDSATLFAFSGDFTIECWVKSSDVADTRTVFGFKYSPYQSQIWLRYTGTTQWSLYYTQSGSVLSYTFNSTNSANNFWVHHAVVRISGVMYWYINGVLVGSAANNYDYSTAGVGNSLNQCSIGGPSSLSSPTTPGYWTGNISNFRVIKGQGIYTSNFTPSSYAFTTTSQGATASNVSLLTCQSSTLVDNSNYNLTITNTNGVILNQPGPTQVLANLFLSNLSAGSSYALAIGTNYKLYTWGLNTSGQLGQNDIVTRSFPTQITSTTSWSQISSGNNHSLAITTDSKLYAWGNNTSSQLGLSDTINRSSPVQVGTSSWSLVSAGTSFTLGLKTDNTLWGWGDTSRGALGINSIPLSWTIINNGVGIHSDYTLWLWGDNSLGQLGINNTAYRSSPVQVGSVSWTVVSSNLSSTMAIKSDGTLWSWGNNSVGQLGISDTNNRSSPVQVGTGSWSTVSLGISNTTLAITNNGRLFGWGLNAGYQLGLNDTINRNSPVQIGTSSYSQVSAGDSYGLAINTTGKLFAWGNNSVGQVGQAYLTANGKGLYGAGGFYLVGGVAYVWGANGNGQLGLNDTINRSSPVQMGTSSDYWKMIGLGRTIGIKIDGTLWTWGYNAEGELGVGDTIDRSSPVQVGSANNWTFAGDSRYTKWAINSAYELYAWGNNGGSSILADGVVYRSNPIQIPGSWVMAKIGNAGSISSSLGIQVNGTLWAWGNNATGLLGQNDIIARSSPVQVTTLSNFIDVAIINTTGGNTAFALASDGKLFAWGNSPFGETGLGNTVTRSSPTQIGSSSWTQIAGIGGPGFSTMIGLTIAGTLFGWGRNNNGMVGDGTTASRSAPTSIAGTWIGLAGSEYIGSSGYTGMAIKSDNTIWTWGINLYSGVGDNTSIDRSAPVQILSNINPVLVLSPIQIGTSSWTQISAGAGHSLALRTDGGLFTWGLNTVGQLGGPGGGATTASTVNRSSPSQIGISSWTTISAGTSISAAIRSDGGLFTWGLNAQGQLGGAGGGATTASTVNRSSPSQIGTSSWTNISASNSFMMGIDYTNRLFTWGNNNLGQLGVGDTIQRSSPVQVGTNYQTLFSNPTQISSASLTNGYSVNFSSTGATDALVIPHNTILDLTSGDFTIECWAYVTSVANSDYILNKSGANGTNVGAYTIQYRTADSTWSFTTSDSTGAVTGTFYTFGTGSIITNNWLHFAVTRSGTTIKTFLNGTLITNVTQGTAINDRGQVLTIGNQINAGGPLKGYVSNLRIVKGQALYTANFTPSTTQLTTTSQGAIAGNVSLLTCQSISFVDNSTNNFPVSQIGTPLINSPYYSQISAGSSHSTTIQSNGLLFNTGDNVSGTLGDSTTVNKTFALPIAYPTLYDNRSSPAQIGTGSWSQIAAGLNYSVAIDINGLLYAWGDNTNGYLGDNTTNVRRSIAQIDTTNSYTSISSGGSHTVALRSDNTLYAWGLNNAGQLGDNSSTNRSSPVQVNTGTVTSWNQIAAGASHTVALDINSTPYAWGLNNSGQLGDNTLTNKSTPVAVTIGLIQNYSLQFGGTSEYLRIGNNTALSFGTGQFTIECWFYNNQSSSNTDAIITKRNTTDIGDWSLTKTSGNTISYVASGAFTITSSFAIQLNTWNHVAVVRNSNNDITMFINGIIAGTGNSNANYNNIQAVLIGAQNSGSGIRNFWNGYISNVRLIKGVALYTTGFYPSTIALTNITNTSLLTGQSATIVDNSTNAFAITNPGASAVTVSGQQPFVYYSSQYTYTKATVSPYLYVNQSGSQLSFGTGDFTIEGFYNLTADLNTVRYLWQYNNLGSGGNLILRSNGSGSNRYLELVSGSTVANNQLIAITWNSNTSSGPLSVGIWYHIAVVKISGVITFYINGISQGSAADAVTYNTTAGFYIGNGVINPGSIINPLSGYISNFRIVKGVGVYTGNFSVPTNNLGIKQSAMTNIVALTGTETVLLTCQSGTQIDKSASPLTISTTIPPTIVSSVQPFSSGGYSPAMDNIQAGATNSLGVSNNTLYVWGAGTAGAIGDGTVVGKSVPTTLGLIYTIAEKLYSSPVQIAVSSGKSWTSVAAGTGHTLAIASDYSLFGWGYNSNGELGNNTTLARSSPVQIGTSSWSSVSAAPNDSYLIRATDRLLFGTGLNSATNFNLGDNTSISRSAPVQLYTSTMTSPLIPIKLNTISTSSFTQVQVGSAASVIGVDGSLWTWGTNTDGQIGDWTNVSRSSPTQVGGLTVTNVASPNQVGTSSYSQVSAGFSHVLALDSNGLLYAWGKTPANGDTITRSSPVQIGSNSWLFVSAGNDISQAIDTTKTLYAWGLNTNYQLGSANFYINQSITSPVAIGTLAIVNSSHTNSTGSGQGGFIKNI
jgi:alpha-tubulin suppressor-like RCC1 family protein